MYAQATVPQFYQRRFAQPFPAVPYRYRGFKKGVQRGIHAQNEKCDCIKYLKLGDAKLLVSIQPHAGYSTLKVA